MKMVYLLWSSDDGDARIIEEIFAHKIDAEECLRQFKEQDQQNGRFDHYWIQEKQVHHGKA
jgi:hypothetical protein